MSTAFDAYFKWLGIPPEEQPPHHYRLLGVPLYVADADVITNAADQRMAHLKGFQTGKYSLLSQEILNEISKARLCLLDARRKAAYDAELRTHLARPSSRAQPAAAPPTSVQPPVSQSPPQRPPVARQLASPQERDQFVFSHDQADIPRQLQRKPRTNRALPIAFVVAALALGAAVVWFFVPFPKEEERQQSPTAALRDTSGADSPPPLLWRQAPAEAATFGSMRIQITEARIGQLPGRAGLPHEPAQLSVHVRMDNIGNQIAEYPGWNGSNGSDSPAMRDDLGNNYPRVSTSKTDQPRKSRVLPGQSHTEILVFQRPVANYGQLEFVLPPAFGGETEPIRFKIPRSFVRLDSARPALPVAAAQPSSSAPMPGIDDRQAGSQAVPTSGATVIAYWRFEGPAAGVPGAVSQAAVEDASGQGNHLHFPSGNGPLRLARMVAYAQVPSSLEPNDQCFDLLSDAGKGGGRGLVTAAAGSPLDLASRRLGAWTVEASFMFSQRGFTHTIVGKDGPPKAGGQSPLQLRVRGDTDRLEVAAIDSAGEERLVTSAANVVPGRWYHVVAASNGNQLRLWLDSGDGGGLKLQGAAPFAGALAQGPGEWSVGRGFGDGQPAAEARMYIDEVRVTAGALEPAQMLMYPASAAQRAARTRPADVFSPGGQLTFYPLKIVSAQAPDGVELQTLDDGSLWIVGANPEKAVYTIRAFTELVGIAGVRLEALADDRLPGSGPGRHSSADKGMQGNFVVTSLNVGASAGEAEVLPTSIGWKSAEADFSQQEFSVESLLDKKAGDGWGIAPATGKGHSALLRAERPFGFRKGTWLTITIEQNFGKQLTLGRFRLSVFTSVRPAEIPAPVHRPSGRPAEPLAKVPVSVSIPELPADGNAIAAAVTAPIQLATVIHTPASKLALALWGGETAADVEGISFRMEPKAEGDEKSPGWKIYLKSPETAADAPPVVAEISFAGDELKFRWTEAATRLPLANYLRNCVLEVKVSDQRRGIALRTPLPAERQALGFGKSPAKPRNEIPWPPKASAMKISLPASQAGVPPYALNRGAASLGKDDVEVTFSENGQPALLSVVECSWKRGLHFNVSAYYVPTAADAKRISFNRVKLDKLRQQYANQLQPLKNRLAVIATAGDWNLSLRAKLEKQSLPKQISELENTIHQIARVLERGEAIEKTGGLPVQLFLELGDFRLVLLENNPK